ncbi:hypothetical protein Afil01_55610 [Actinorhabdospora filicis]|uniref:Uncharacterized protein n=1 Tax=Actinorhabdospora filicis TaxID=1785913 RepID=A0A9W6SRQ1_9ACTN|nr:hypothetical protein [Actinorhabdospora filicis]GLZ80754.1 hypothetical protein Afil01_55610 [Actinorhabdospora filicis]
MPADVPVTRETIRRSLRPMSDPRPMPLTPERVWSDEEWARIRLGLAARDMDDRWDVLTEDRVVHMHRSWTGYEIFAAVFAPAEGGWRITDALVEHGPERFRSGGDAEDRRLLEAVLDIVLRHER